MYRVVREQLRKSSLQVEPDEHGDLGKDGRRKCAEISAKLYGRRLHVQQMVVMPDASPMYVDIDELPMKPLARYDVGYRTGSDKYLDLTVDLHVLPREDVPLLSVYERYTACGDCKGGDGGCPYFAPVFWEMSLKLQALAVIVVHMDMAWSMHYTLYSDRMHGRIMYPLMYADRIRMHYVHRLLRSILHTCRDTVQIYPLYSGNCKGCSASKCTVRVGGKCSHPDRRTFSMEAVGINCDILHLMFYGEYLPWYYHETGMLPTYMTHYIGILLPGTAHASHIVNALRDAVYNDEHYCEFQADKTPVYEEVMVTLQRHKRYVGTDVAVYRDLEYETWRNARHIQRV